MSVVWSLEHILTPLSLFGHKFRYVVDEANVETDGMKPMGRLANDLAWEEMFVSRVKRMVQRDWNHPSIIFWSLGNESGRGFNLRNARRAILEIDTSRPICYEGGKRTGYEGELLHKSQYLAMSQLPHC